MMMDGTKRISVTFRANRRGKPRTFPNITPIDLEHYESPSELTTKITSSNSELNRYFSAGKRIMDSGQLDTRKRQD